MGGSGVESFLKVLLKNFDVLAGYYILRSLQLNMLPVYIISSSFNSFTSDTPDYIMLFQDTFLAFLYFEFEVSSFLCFFFFFF